MNLFLLPLSVIGNTHAWHIHNIATKFKLICIIKYHLREHEYIVDTIKFLMSEIIKQQDLKLLFYLQGTVAFYNSFSPVWPVKWMHYSR